MTVTVSPCFHNEHFSSKFKLLIPSLETLYQLTCLGQVPCDCVVAVAKSIGEFKLHPKCSAILKDSLSSYERANLTKYFSARADFYIFSAGVRR